MTSENPRATPVLRSPVLRRDEEAIRFRSPAAAPGPFRPPMARRTKRRLRLMPSRALVLALVYVFVLAGIAYLGLRGASYYLTPLVERPRHAGYWIYKPGGRLGLTYAVSGTAALLAMHLYSLRKRWKLLRRWGSVRVWLDFHIFLGVIGPLLILLHTSFKFRGIVSISFWSMVVVAISGFVGRYLYLQIPRSIHGEELSLAEAEAEHHALCERLEGDFAFAPDELAIRTTGSEAGTLRLLLLAPVEWLTLPIQLRWRQRGSGMRFPSALRRELVRIALREASLRRRLLLWESLRELFHHWHVFHRPFALLLYLFLAVHLAVAWSTGYLRGWWS